MAYETMPLKQKNKVSHLLRQLDVNKSSRLNPHKLKNRDLETWFVRVDQTVRLLFTKNEQGFLIIDIIDHKKEAC
jgi:Txe/YoeB family toxin of Txe-Axe toxin-antitoxin module